MHDTSNDFLPSSVLQCTDIRIVRVVVLLRVVVLAQVPHGWNITVRVAGCTSFVKVRPVL